METTADQRWHSYKADEKVLYANWRTLAKKKKRKSGEKETFHHPGQLELRTPKCFPARVCTRRHLEPNFFLFARERSSKKRGDNEFASNIQSVSAETNTETSVCSLERFIRRRSGGLPLMRKLTRAHRTRRERTMGGEGANECENNGGTTRSKQCVSFSARRALVFCQRN